MGSRRALALVAGFALDALLGDPKGWPHPVRLIGKQVELEERLVRDCVLEQAEGLGDGWPFDQAATERIGGMALAADVALFVPLVTSGALKHVERVHPVAALAVETFLFYQLIAARSLKDESMAVYGELAAGDLVRAREAVSMIVGRDTETLDEEGVARAAVETIAENTSDGVVAPVLFMGLGGVSTAMFYKAVNTMDSMVGYKNDRYANLGWAAAKLDDVVNVVPSRVSGVLMCVAAKLTGMDAKRAWRMFKRDRYNHSSPNSAQTEAACAGALGVQLGGPNRYFGKMVDKPTIGDAARPIEAEDITRANKLMYATAVLGVALAAFSSLLCERGRTPGRGTKRRDA